MLIDYTSHDVVQGERADRDRARRRRSSSARRGSPRPTSRRSTPPPASAGVGVIAAGNFSVTAAMAQAAALLAARHLPSWEVIDYASAGKADAPSGTARELAERLGEVRRRESSARSRTRHGAREARGADDRRHAGPLAAAAELHVSTEVVFGLPDERLSIRHDAGGSAAPYVAGHAARRPRRARPDRAHARAGHAAAGGLTLRSRGLSEPAPTLRRSFPADRAAPRSRATPSRSSCTARRRPAHARRRAPRGLRGRHQLRRPRLPRRARRRGRDGGRAVGPTSCCSRSPIAAAGWRRAPTARVSGSGSRSSAGSPSASTSPRRPTAARS